MDALVALLFTITCGYLILRMAKARDAVDIQLGVIGVFSVGYYCLPIWFKQLSPLRDLPVRDIVAATMIHWLFLAALIVGTESGRQVIAIRKGLMTDHLDRVITNFHPILVFTAFAIYIWYYFTQDITSYSSGNFESFFANRGPLFAIIANISNLSLAFMAYSVALAWKNGSRNALLYSGMLGFCLLLLFFVGQRLALLAPVIMLLGSLAITGQAGRAKGLLGIAVAILLVVSPIAVFVRQSLADKNAATATSAVSSFSYGDNAAGTIFQSIIDRGDLIYVTARMKPYIDAEPRPGFIYYGSVLAIPIPKAVFPGHKPYLLSTNGAPGGELSIKSWLTLLGGTGSLSAFGGIVAYREASWFGVLLNGLATGVLFIFLNRWLGRGGILAGVFYAQLFVLITVKKVPPSFFEALAELMGLLPLMLILILINWLLTKSPKQIRSPAPMKWTS
jgi:hypothetical protein